MEELSLFALGVLLYLIFKLIFRGFFVVNQNERAVKTAFGRAKRLHHNADSSQHMSQGMAMSRTCSQHKDTMQQ